MEGHTYRRIPRDVQVTMRILVCGGNVATAKSYPFWDQFMKLAKDHEIRKIEGILPLDEIMGLIQWADAVISIDSFIPHLIRFHKIDKPVVVIWGTSHPAVFGYTDHVNLLKDPKYLRPDPFLWWRDEPNNPDAFVAPEVIIETLKKFGG